MGALDGTYISIETPASMSDIYINRKGFISVNVFAACDKDMKFIYVLTGWEGSANDGRVLRDALNHGFSVLRGNCPTPSYLLVYHLHIMSVTLTGKMELGNCF